VPPRYTHSRSTARHRTVRRHFPASWLSWPPDRSCCWC